MRIRLLCIGKIKEKYLRAGIAEYVKRLGPFAKLEISELDEERMPENPSAAEKTQALEREGERLLKQVKNGSTLALLDVAGKNLLARFMADLSVQGQSDITLHHRRCLRRLPRPAESRPSAPVLLPHD
ncbi:MAG TPA: 23S rRNA (pseudouridine(1915)-N(3))-methyltransferase RlmH, partial [Negativicutes bacterium]|nr:23S rRNA (pseudouridine(1915)-N(3))-methyltransferase RlmH [Negativicutes bacterium]